MVTPIEEPVSDYLDSLNTGELEALIVESDGNGVLKEIDGEEYRLTDDAVHSFLDIRRAYEENQFADIENACAEKSESSLAAVSRYNNASIAPLVTIVLVIAFVMTMTCRLTS